MRKVILSFFILLTVAGTVLAQRNGNSPYTRFGLGEVYSNNFMHLRQMGHISSAYIDQYHINVDNPASYAYLASTSFDIGLSAKRSTLSDATTNGNAIWSGNLDYLSLAFPLQNDLNQILDRAVKPYRFGAAVTLAPVTNVGYNVVSEKEEEGIGKVNRNFNGSGGTYKFMGGLGFKYKDFSVGVNAGYLFGRISHSKVVRFPDLPFAYNNDFSRRYNTSGWLFDIGTMYTFTLNKKALEKEENTAPNYLTIGLRYSSQTSISTSTDILERAIQSGTNTTEIAREEYGIEGKAILPGSIGVGLNYRLGYKFSLGVDYKAGFWSNYYNEATGEVKETLKNTSSVSLGGFYRPRYNSYTSFWDRVYYRYGVYNKTEPVTIGDTQIKSWGVTAGVGMPFVFQRKASHASIGFELGRTSGSKLIKENFIKINLGFTFNDDEWFLKRKYN